MGIERVLFPAGSSPEAWPTQIGQVGDNTVLTLKATSPVQPKQAAMAIQEELITRKNSLPLKSLNHVSRVCRNVYLTTQFYETVLGFIPIVRPGALKFDGAW